MRTLARILALTAATPAVLAGQQLFSGTGSDADVTAALNAYRTALGTLNANTPGSFGSGRREINWDAVPDTASSPNAFPGDFFNANAAGRARGAVFSTPGSGLQVSADSDNPTATPGDFANLNPQYADLFRAFSPQRLFAAVDSNIIDVNFFVPGSNTPATVSGFGAIFSDVDEADSTFIEFFDAQGGLLSTAYAPAATTANEGSSFVGALFDGGQRVARVRITAGDVALGAGGLEGEIGGAFADAVATDDFVFGEPVAVPEPASLGLLSLAGVWLMRRR